MRIKVFSAAAAAAALSLCGCDGWRAESPAEPVGEHVIDPATGETRITINGKEGPAILRAGPAVPVSLPQGLSLPPGAQVTHSARVTGPRGVSTLITFTADSPPAAIARHTREAAVAAGFAITVDLTAGDARTLVAERAGDGARLSLDVTAGPPASAQLTILTPAR